MAKLLVVRGRDSFSALSRHGRRVREGPLTVVYRAGPDEARVAFSVSRSVGPAVVRNRLRRRLRALWRDHEPAPGDYLILTAPPATRLSFAELGDRLQAALARLEPA
jgi:ribonuclease P protein component